MIQRVFNFMHTSLKLFKGADRLRRGRGHDSDVSFVLIDLLIGTNR